MSKKREKLSLEEAKIAADWPRREVHAAMKKYGVELSGEHATAMKHGLVLIDDHGPLFIAKR